MLPRGYTKARRFGGYSNRHSQRYVAPCRELLAAGESAKDGGLKTEDVASRASIDASAVASREQLCPDCIVPLRCVLRLDRPGWSRVLMSPHRPKWYDDG